MVNAHVNTQNIKQLISDIPDPEIPVITINDLGILRDVAYQNNQYVVTITPTYTACPAMPLLEEQIKDKLHTNGISNVKVVLTYVPAWTTDWMTKDAKEKMRVYGIAPPQHSSCNKVYNKNESVKCPRCNSSNTELISRFGSTACKGLCKCNSCNEPFEYFKCH